MADLVSRKEVLDILCDPKEDDKIRIIEKVFELPFVPAVPLDKLCEWLAGNVYLKDDTEIAWELNPDNWKKLLIKWMEKQDESA